MSQIILAFRHGPRSASLFEWQRIFNDAFASGSLTTAFLNLGMLLTVSLGKAAAERFRRFFRIGTTV